MEIFCVDTTKAMNSMAVKHWVNDLMEKGVLMGGSIESVITRHTIHQSVQPDGTNLDLMVVGGDYDALLINYQGDQIIQGNFLVGYKLSFGNPLPFIKRMVISMDGLTGFEGLANISVRADYMAVEAEVERLIAEADKPAPKPKPKPKKKATAALKAKPTVNQLAPKSKAVTTKNVQQSLF